MVIKAYFSGTRNGDIHNAGTNNPEQVTSM